MQVNRAATMELEWVPANSTVAETAKKMKQANVGLLLVADKCQLLGVITDRDVVIRAVADSRDVDRMCARDIMSAPVICIAGDAQIADAAKMMIEHKVRRLVVVNDERRPVGVLSIDDLAFSTHGDSTVGQVLEEIATAPEHLSLIRGG